VLIDARTFPSPVIYLSNSGVEKILPPKNSFLLRLAFSNFVPQSEKEKKGSKIHCTRIVTYALVVRQLAINYNRRKVLSADPRDATAELEAVFSARSER
jgi:hypothetical protein